MYDDKEQAAAAEIKMGPAHTMYAAQSSVLSFLITQFQFHILVQWCDFTDATESYRQFARILGEMIYVFPNPIGSMKGKNTISACVRIMFIVHVGASIIRNIAPHIF